VGGERRVAADPRCVAPDAISLVFSPRIRPTELARGLLGGTGDEVNVKRANDDSQIEGVALEVTRYLESHPEASDTIEGIAKWWLSRQRLEESTELVAQAVERLVLRGVVERHERNGVALFRHARGPGR
jgi:hypothetical protein